MNILKYNHEYDENCYAEVKYDIANKVYHIDFYNEHGFISRKIFENKSLRYVEDAAENWCLGIGISI